MENQGLDPDITHRQRLLLGPKRVSKHVLEKAEARHCANIPSQYNGNDIFDDRIVET